MYQLADEDRDAVDQSISNLQAIGNLIDDDFVLEIVEETAGLLMSVLAKLGGSRHAAKTTDAESLMLDLSVAIAEAHAKSDANLAAANAEIDALDGCLRVSLDTYQPTPSEKRNADLIRLARKERGMTLTEAARAVDCSVVEWSAWERAIVPLPTDGMWQKIIEVLGL